MISAYQIMPKDEDIYPQVETRQAVLSDFIKQITTINENDSLLTLAKMDSTSLNDIFLTNRSDRLRKRRKTADKEKRANRIKKCKYKFYQ